MISSASSHREASRAVASSLLPPGDALALVQRAKSERIPILGIDGFHVGPDFTGPELAHSIDLSGASCRTNPWAVAIAFLEERDQSGLHFEVVLGDSPVGR